MRFKQVNDAEWVQPVRRGYRLACCDCSLVHTIDFRLVPIGNGRNKIQLRASRDGRATRAYRKTKPRDRLEALSRIEVAAELLANMTPAERRKVMGKVRAA